MTEAEILAHNERNKSDAALAFVRNSVYEGRQAQLAALGVSPGVIADAEAWVADERARAKAHAAANPLTEDEQALAMLHPSHPDHAALHEKVTGQKPVGYAAASNSGEKK